MLKRLAAWGGLVLLALTACTTVPASYFKEGVGQETQEAVARRLGPP